jgi:hypothetical protein
MTNLRAGIDRLVSIMGRVLCPNCFFAARGVQVSVVHTEREEVFWEIYRGRLLGAGQTRNVATFESWNVALESRAWSAPEPVLSVKLALDGGSIHVMRWLLTYVWEGYAAEENVILSREVQKRVPELIGTIDLTDCPAKPKLAEELALLIHRAVVGTSRLPLTSLEAPLPSFSLGQLGYFPAMASKATATAASGPSSPSEWLEAGLGPGTDAGEQAKLIEVLVRAGEPATMPALAGQVARTWQLHGRSPSEFASLCRTLINQTALSPYTHFVDSLLSCLTSLVDLEFLSAAQVIDFESHVLRALVRHLTAYDLVTFHNRGANYPDALMLDAILKDYLSTMELHPGHFMPSTDESEKERVAKRLRRRALRQAWLMRQVCVGLPVPDMPTSPGENQRVLPPPFVRVPDEQLTNPDCRTKRLFVDQPELEIGAHGRQILQASVRDLDSAREVRELGMALFLDRPLGIFKAPGEPDQTPLLSFECFSSKIALERIGQLSRHPELAPVVRLQAWEATVSGQLAQAGLGLRLASQQPRPATVSLDDAVRVSADFRVLRNTTTALRQCLQALDFSPLARWNASGLGESEHIRLFVRAASIGSGDQGELQILDGRLRPILQVRVDGSLGYVCRSGIEFPAAGLLVERIWTPAESGGSLPAYGVAAERVHLLARRI